MLASRTAASSLLVNLPVIIERSSKEIVNVLVTVSSSAAAGATVAEVPEAVSPSTAPPPSTTRAAASAAFPSCGFCCCRFCRRLCSMSLRLISTGAAFFEIGFDSLVISSVTSDKSTCI